MSIEKHTTTRGSNADRLEEELHRALRQIERETPPERIRMLALTLMQVLRARRGGTGSDSLAEK